MPIHNINMDTRDFGGNTAEADPWKSRDVDVHEARDKRAAEAGRIIDEQRATSTGQALLRLPEFVPMQTPLPQEDAPLKRDREALRRREKRVFFEKRA